MQATLADLFRAAPVRTALLSIAPLLLAVAQGVNALWHGVSLVYAAAFALVMVGFAVGTTRHALSAFRLRSLEDAHEN
ncbi:MAG: hypothetical protein ABEJ04_05275 [Halobacteriaceae archaeon]